jgi:hypothetical protein
MSSSEKTLAEKIARLLDSESQSPDHALLYASIDKLNHRLDKLEATLTSPAAVRDLKSIHPSLDKFDVAEAIADEIFVGLQKEKACTFEPNGKPCDHCAMCSSRGF